MMQYAVDVLLQAGANRVLLGLQVDEVHLGLRGRKCEIPIRAQGEIRIAREERLVARQQLDGACRKAGQRADELFVFRVIGTEHITFSAERCKPVLVASKSLEHFPSPLHRLLIRRSLIPVDGTTL